MATTIRTHRLSGGRKQIACYACNVALETPAKNSASVRRRHVNSPEHKAALKRTRAERMAS